MYYTVYRTTNKVNGKTYIGSHKTSDLDDGYLGSGTLLKRAINKYGIDAFTKEVLFVYDNPEQMWAKEAELVDLDYLTEGNTYNLKVGGFGGFDYLNSIKDNPTHSTSHSKMMEAKRKAKWPNGIKPDLRFQPLAKVCQECGMTFVCHHSSQSKQRFCSVSCGSKFNNRRGITGVKGGFGFDPRVKYPQARVTCPRCGKVGGVSAMKRWHFDRCSQLDK